MHNNRKCRCHATCIEINGLLAFTSAKEKDDRYHAIGFSRMQLSAFEAAQSCKLGRAPTSLKQSLPVRVVIWLELSIRLFQSSLKN